VYIDKVVVLKVAFELDDKQNSWEKICGNIERAFVYNAPVFVKYDDHRQKIEIKPQNKVDQGLHIILIEVVIKSMKSLHMLEILVKLPISHIGSHLKPYFLPALEDDQKEYGERWQDDLSSIRDPADKFVHVSKSRISPELASTFVKTILSSDTIANRTLIFSISEKEWSEKTGNVSFFVEVSAFNQNYSVYASQNEHTKT